MSGLLISFAGIPLEARRMAGRAADCPRMYEVSRIVPPAIVCFALFLSSDIVRMRIALASIERGGLVRDLGAVCGGGGGAVTGGPVTVLPAPGHLTVLPLAPPTGPVHHTTVHHYWVALGGPGSRCGAAS